jgi:hypothetical protein
LLLLLLLPFVHNCPVGVQHRHQQNMLNNKCKLLVVALLCVNKMQRRFVGAFAPQCFRSAFKRTTIPTLYPSVRWMASSETGERTEEEQEAIKAAREAKK